MRATGWEGEGDGGGDQDETQQKVGTGRIVSHACNRVGLPVLVAVLEVAILMGVVSCDYVSVCGRMRMYQ